MNLAKRANLPFGAGLINSAGIVEFIMASDLNPCVSGTCCQSHTYIFSTIHNYLCQDVV